ncbi:hypothetical protein Dsin_029048 [Dipteronia sinensis]|uniref:Uncharacterized protein n=1 Tax=Dipteronia sinensis TaxID=43782 RepID=A0AAD9ZT10_9ROSI|nr:hypothetical protein Dsin_029048 [Dipteronia sinensis]
MRTLTMGMTITRPNRIRVEPVGVLAEGIDHLPLKAMIGIIVENGRGDQPNKMSPHRGLVSEVNYQMMSRIAYSSVTYSGHRSQKGSGGHTLSSSKRILTQKSMKKSAAHLSQLRQENDELLKKYLTRFGQEVSEIGSANDEAIIVAFINNLHNGRLSFYLKRACLTSYVDMMNMAGGFQGKYTNYTPLKKKHEEILTILEEKNLSKEPLRHSKFARKDTIKYFRFHKENGQETLKCFQLKDHIETFICEGHLKDIILKKTDDQPHRDNH